MRISLHPRVSFGAGDIRLIHSGMELPASPQNEPSPLELLLNLVNGHAARLIVRERLRVIAVARVHPHT